MQCFLLTRNLRLFLVHLGEIEEYGEVHTPDVPGNIKEGDGFLLSGHRFERHIDYHVSLHIKDVIKKLETFLAAERIERIITGGSDDAVAKVRRCFQRQSVKRLWALFMPRCLRMSMMYLKKSNL